MKRMHRPVTMWMLACFTVISVALMIPWIMWQSQASFPLNILIIDKSSPDSSYLGHKGLVWLLNHQKIVKLTGQYYTYEEDYYGYDTRNGVPRINRILPDEVKDTDMVYLTANRRSLLTSKEQQLHSGIYEGLSIYDVQKTREAANKGATIVAEFSAILGVSSDITRKQLYPVLGVSSNGWRGKSISDLQSLEEVPAWVRSNYELREKRKWGYSGTGMLFVHTNGQVVVLESGAGVKTGQVQIAFTQEGKRWCKINGDVHYDEWFDIVVPEQKHNVLAWYKTDLTDQGREKLKSAGIPTTFAALIRYDNGYLAYYMAGSFGDMKNYSFWRRILGWDVIQTKLTPDRPDVPDRFYWKVYVPVMKRILHEVRAGRQHWP